MNIKAKYQNTALVKQTTTNNEQDVVVSDKETEQKQLQRRKERRTEVTLAHRTWYTYCKHFVCNIHRKCCRKH